MKITIDAMYAKSIMKDYDRDYYTTTALEAILDYYDEVDDNTEFDPVEICCDWNEYGDNCALTLSDLFNDYGYKLADINAYEYDDDKADALVEELENHTYIVKLNNGNILLQTF